MDYVGIGIVVRGPLLGIVVLSMLLLLVMLLLLLLVVVILVADVPCLGLLNDVLFRTGTIL